MILVHFPRAEFTGEKSELLQLPLLAGKGKRKGKTKKPKEPYNCQKQPFCGQQETTISERHFASPPGEREHIKNGHFFPGFFMYFEWSFSHRLTALLQRLKEISECFMPGLE